MGLSCTVSEINGDFNRKSQNSTVNFVPLLRGFPLELGIGAVGEKTRIMALPGRERERSLTISSAVLIPSTIVTDGRTDRQTNTGRQQRPRLRIASRGKNDQCNTSSKLKLLKPFLSRVSAFVVGCDAWADCVRQWIQTKRVALTRDITGNWFLVANNLL